MSREYFLQLAGRGVRMPIGTDLLLHELPDPETAVLDGRRLAEVMRSAAVRYQTPLAVPLMDLRLEKADLLRMLGIAEEEADRFHFACVPGAREIAAVEAALESPFSQRIQAHLDSIRIIADEGKLFPLGMAIGPFSLTTKMLADPILAIAMAGGGTTAEESSEVAALETCLKLAELVVARSLRAQVAAGARGVIVCEPAANRVFISPRQVARGSGCWENLVM